MNYRYKCSRSQPHNNMKLSSIFLLSILTTSAVVLMEDQAAEARSKICSCSTQKVKVIRQRQRGRLPKRFHKVTPTATPVTDSDTSEAELIKKPAPGEVQTQKPKNTRLPVVPARVKTPTTATPTPMTGENNGSGSTINQSGNNNSIQNQNIGNGNSVTIPANVGNSTSFPPILDTPTSPNSQKIVKPVENPTKADKSNHIGVGGVYNTTTGAVTPEINYTRQLGNNFSLNGYVGIGNTGYNYYPGKSEVPEVATEAKPGQPAKYENWVSKVTPGKQYVAAAPCDRSIFFWQDRNGIIQQSVKDYVYNDSQIAEKKQWILDNGGTWYGWSVLPANQTQLATSTKTDYVRVKVADEIAAQERIVTQKYQAAVAARKEALFGITGGVEVGYQIINGLEVTAGAKIAGGIVPTVGANLTAGGESGYVQLGVRQGLATGAGTDIRAGAGFNF